MMHRSRGMSGVGFQSFSVHLLSTRVIVGVLVCGSPAIGQDSEAPFIVHDGGPDALTTPCTGYVDPRLEVNPSSPFNPAGLHEVFIKFNTEVFKSDGESDVDAGNFTLTECLGGDPPVIDDVSYVGGNKSYVRVHWDGPIALQKWTTLKADLFNSAGVPIEDVGDLGEGQQEPDRMDYAALPGDIDQNTRTEILDLLRYRSFLTGGACNCPDCGGEALYFDTDRNFSGGQILDFLRFRQLLLGTPPATQAWLLETLDCEQP